MADNESYLRGLRRLVGSRLLLSPAAQLAVVDADERILYERRGDNGLWGIPSGAAEPGSSLAGTAVAELREEVGLIVNEADLVAFGALSEPDLYTFTYLNGDQLQAFSLMFEVRTLDRPVATGPQGDDGGGVCGAAAGSGVRTLRGGPAGVCGPPRDGPLSDALAGRPATTARQLPRVAWVPR